MQRKISFCRSCDYEHNQYLDHAKYSFFLPEYHDHRQGLINELKFLSYDIPNSLTNKDIREYLKLSTDETGIQVMSV